MRLSCLQDNLIKGLGIVGKAAAAKTTLPITNNVLLVSEQSRLRLTATNLEMAITCWIGAKVEEEGAITVPARLITEFINTLPNEKIDLSVSDYTLELQCGRFEARMSGMDAVDFPPIPNVSGGVTTRVDPEIFRSAINQVAFATASEDTRPILTGVHIEADADILTMAAADGYRLAVYTMPLGARVDEKIEFTVPGRSLAELHRLLADQDEEVEISINPGKGQASFQLKSIQMVSQLLQGTFPNYHQLIPQSYGNRATVNTADFLRATRTASIFARDGSGIIRLQIEPTSSEESESGTGKMAISARSEQVGDNVGEIDAQVEGDTSKIAFNAKYLIDALSVLRENEVILETTSPSTAGVIRPVGSNTYIHVIMPIHVQW